MIIFDFVPVWTLIVGLAVFFYVLLDGFDLGVGILYNFAKTAADRNLLMNSIAPIWDGNETWLVLGGLGLLAAFPLAFAIILPAVYFPILVMLLALIFRGVAFEFRFRDVEHRTFWIMPLAMARRWRPSPKAWCWAPSSKASKSKDGISAAAVLIASRPSRCLRACRCYPAMVCWARAG